MDINYTRSIQEYGDHSIERRRIGNHYVAAIENVVMIEAIIKIVQRAREEKKHKNATRAA
jgi:hypothetical protein